MKIDYRKHYIMVVDIETANDVDEGIAYDIGFIVADTKGNIYEQGSYMVQEMFFDYKDLLETAYYYKKLPQYWKEYHEGKREIRSILTIKRIMNSLIYQYRIKDIYAYNCAFDSYGLNRTIRYLTKSKSRYFFQKGLNFYCIWNIACQTIFQSTKNQKIALQNIWYNENTQNMLTSAEMANRYITGNAGFKEAHTGLEDVYIEYQILLKCLSQHKKLDKNINRKCWQLPQKKFQEILKKHLTKS